MAFRLGYADSISLACDAADFSSGEISDLKKAFRILFGSGGPLARRLSDMEGIASPHVTHLITFIRNSKRSFHTRKSDKRD